MALAGHHGAPRETTIVPDDIGRSVTRAARTTPTTVVVLYTIAGGGHAVPGPGSRFPALVGTVERRSDALAEAVRVFLPAPRSLDADAAPASAGGQSPSGMTAQRMR